jgi:hypothetical protein
MRDDLNNALNTRLQRVVSKGQFLISHSYHDYTFMLYSVESDLVELLYDRKVNTVVWVTKVNDQDLTKYLNLIELDVRGLL